MKKRILSFLLCSCLLFIGVAQVSASENIPPIPDAAYTDITPYMSYIINSASSMSIDKYGLVAITASVYGYTDIVSKVSISSSLQQYKNNSWITLKTYTAESNSHTTSLSETYTVNKGYSYRLVSTVKAYSGSLSETRTITSPEKAY